MQLIPFHASRLKIRRAGQHVATLQAELDSYVSRSPLYLEVRVKPDDARYIEHELIISEPAPEILSAIVGDIIHNLRTSLDLLVCEAVRLNGKSDKGVHFPFAESEDELEGQMKRWHLLSRATPEVLTLIRDLKPYKGGNAALRGVHDLDVIDKHRELLADFADVKWPYGGAGVHLSSSIHPDRFRAGGYCLADLAIERGFIVGEKLPAELNLTFPTGGPFSGLSLVPTLRDLTADFSRIVDAFEALLFGAIPNPSA